MAFAVELLPLEAFACAVSLAVVESAAAALAVEEDLVVVVELPSFEVSVELIVINCSRLLTATN
jgi:hypothetical protein